MKISELSNFSIGNIGKPLDKLQKSNTEDVFGKLIDAVKVAQNDSVKLTDKFISGEDVELHEVMIAGEKAKTSLQMLMEIRNKALDMYKELTRISI
jgi:flagellar hook-basal body complex protein FliE